MFMPVGSGSVHRRTEVCYVTPLASTSPIGGGESDETMPQAVDVVDRVDQTPPDPASLVANQHLRGLASEHGIRLELLESACGS